MSKTAAKKRSRPARVSSAGSGRGASARPRTGPALARPLVVPAPAPLLPAVVLERLLGLALARGAELAEVYVEKGTTSAVVLDEHRVKSAQVGESEGVGVRAVRGAQVGYAYSPPSPD